MSRKPGKELHDQETLLTGTRRTIVLITLGVIVFVANIDGNGISTILPTMAADLGAEKTILWAGTSSLIANTIFTVQYGRLSDIFGRTICLVGTCCIFAVAELICGFSQSGPMLYVARGITGMSGGALASLIVIVASDIVPLEKRGKYQGLVGGWASLGTVTGPYIASGFAIGVTWRAFFWFLVPMGLGAAGLGYWLLPETKPTDTFSQNVRKVDWFGALSSAFCIVAFLIPVSGAGSYYAWDDGWVIALLVLALVSLVAFIVIEWKFAALPMIPLGMLKNRSVLALMAQTFFVAWVGQVNIYFVPLYAQNLRGWTIFSSAALLSANVATMGLFAVISGYYISSKKRYGGVIRLGNVLLFLGTGLTVLFGRTTSTGVLVSVLILSGIGLGCTAQPSVIALQAHTKKKYRAVVVSCRNFMRSLGAATGIATSAGIFQSSLKRRLPEWARLQVSESTYSIPAQYRDELSPYYAKAMRDVWITGTAVMAVCLLLGFFWKDKGLARKEDLDIEKDRETSLNLVEDVTASEFLIVLEVSEGTWGSDVANSIRQIV